MEKKDNDSRFEIAVRILGNEFIALKIGVNDMKQKWIGLGLIVIISLTWGMSTFGPVLMDMFK